MNPSRPSTSRRAALVAPALAVLAGCGGLTPPVPAALMPDATETPARTLAAHGVQVYECRADAGPAWQLVAPDAELFDRKGRRVGHHGAGPHWRAEDGSRVDGELKSSAAAPATGAIPWLLLAARSSGPQGAFSKVTSIQRINTAGGVAPAAACNRDSAGNVVRVPYRADYRLFVSRGPGNPSFAPF